MLPIRNKYLTLPETILNIPFKHKIIKQIMKKICNLLFTAIAALLLFGVTSCSDSKTKELLSVAGDDAVAVALINPVQVLKSLDASFEDGQVVLPSSLRKLAGDGVKEISKLRGIDYERVMVAGYEKSPYSTIAVLIKDGAEVESSLKKFGLKKKNIDDKAVFVEEDATYGGDVALVEGNVLIFIPGLWYEDEAALKKIVRKTFDKMSEPLADWKVDAIQSRSSKTMYGIVVSPEAKVDFAMAFSVELDGAKAKFEGKVMNTSGKEIDLSTEAPVELAPIGDLAKFVSEDDNIAFAFGGLKDMSVLKALDKYGESWMLRDVERNLRGLPVDSEDILKALSGGFFFTANLDNPAKQPESLKGVTGAFGVATLDGRGAKLLKNLKSLAKDAGLKVSGDDDGFEVKIPRQGNIRFFVDGDCLAVATAEKSPNSAMGSKDDWYAFASVNLPANFFGFKQAGIKFGVKGSAHITKDEIEGEVELTNTDKPFLLTLVEAGVKLQGRF